MDVVERWWLRLTAAALATLTVWMLPAAAWADSHPNVVAIGAEVARKKPRSSGGFGLVAIACCCLIVVLVVVGIVFLIRRRRQPQQTPPQ